MSRKLSIDFETTSLVDLKKAGAVRYAEDPSTKVLCVAWAWDDGPVQSLILPRKSDIQIIFDCLQTGDTVHAWNAMFEQAILQRHFNIHYWMTYPPALQCTMQRALYCGYPGALELAGRAIHLPVHLRKDPAGHRLMLRMCKPKKKGTTDFWHEDPSEGPDMLRALADYCMKDVEAERAIGKLLQVKKLPPPEQEVSGLDARINQNGILIDLPLIDTMMQVAGTETDKLNQECSILTNGQVTSPGTQTDKLTAWLHDNGCDVDDLAKENIFDALESAQDLDLPEHVVRVLGIRRRVAKSSVKKLASMKACVSFDGRIYGALQYYGAGRTGRWAGRLLQPQNFPRPTLDAGAIIETLKGPGDIDPDPDILKIFHGEPLEAIASSLRGCVIPPPGFKLVAIDLAQIEARVLAWLAGQQDVLDAFIAGKDIYQHVADAIGLPSRLAGKVAVLGLGYGAGPAKFVSVAKGYGLILEPHESETIVRTWRDGNPRITGLWRDLDSIVRRLTIIPGTLPLRNIGIRITPPPNRQMTIGLPSGRHLFYHNIRLIPDPDDVQHRDMIVFDGVHQITKQWSTIKTYGAKLAENITQAVARDIIVAVALEADKTLATKSDVMRPILSVHDELVYEVEAQHADDMLDFLKLIPEFDLPPWAKGLPVAADGKVMDRYGK